MRTPPVVSLGVFAGSLTEEGHLECEQHQIMGWGPRLNKGGWRDGLADKALPLQA